ncbi:nitroreductase family protein [Paenibacillus dakarensis]|uniref:nitroreductase family protein n=1 Tax=Paenibacillus dakarensis TaxID=1527293 RepID=UPI0006D5833A|nr:nitroreductase family protein [Paenibacillus dakarensis]
MSLKRENNYFNLVKERRSVRYYDPSITIPREEMEEILTEAALAPSSSNLQPWRFLVIDEKELKEKLHPIANNQNQVLQASAVIAVLGDMKWYEKGKEIYSQAYEAGLMTEDIKDRFIASSAMYHRLDDAKKKSIVDIDGGLVSMQLMLSAKARGYDTVPMGGFNAEKFKQEFNVPDQYETIMLIAIGKAANPGFPSVRLPLNEITFWNQII